MRMRTVLAAAVLGSAALLGPVGTAVADDHGNDVMGGSSQATQDGNAGEFSAGWLWGSESATDN